MRYINVDFSPMHESLAAYDAFVADGVVVIGRGNATDYATDLERLVAPMNMHAVIHCERGGDECVVKIEERRPRAEEPAPGAEAPGIAVVDACGKALGHFDGIEIDLLDGRSALVKVPAWHRIETLSHIVAVLDPVGIVRTLHDSPATIDGSRMTLVVTERG